MLRFIVLQIAVGLGFALLGTFMPEQPSEFVAFLYAYVCGPIVIFGPFAVACWLNWFGR